MAAKRNYAAEYERRQAIARQHGFGSYWERRQARAAGFDRAEKTLSFDRKRNPMTNDQRQRAIRSKVDEYERTAAKSRAKGLSDSQQAKLWSQGDAAMRRKDFKEANRIARRLGVTGSNPGRIFYYHE